MRSGSAILVSGLIVGLLALSLIPAPAQASHLDPFILNLGEPVNDHHVENGTFQDTTFAQGFVRWGTGSGTNIRRGFVEWNLSLIPSDHSIVSASIAVFQSSSPTTGFETLVCLVDESWSELTINFTNQPAVSLCPQTFSVATVGGLKNVSLEPFFLNSWRAGPNFGLRLNMTVEDPLPVGQSVTWEGKEASEPHPGDSTPSPTLYVTVRPPSENLPTGHQTVPFFGLAVGIATLILIAATLNFLLTGIRTAKDIFILVIGVVIFITTWGALVLSGVLVSP